MSALADTGTLPDERAGAAGHAIVHLSDPLYAQQIAGWLAECGMTAHLEQGDRATLGRLDSAKLLVIDRLVTDTCALGALSDLRSGFPALRILAVGDQLSRDAWNLGRMRNHGAAAHRVLPGRPSREVFVRTVRDLV